MKGLLEKLPFWEKLTIEEKSEVKKYAKLKEYKKGSLIHSENSDCLGMIMIVTGEVRTYIMSDEGREVNLFKIKEDECCVLSASCLINQITFETYMVAEKDCNILIISDSLFNKLINNNIYVRCFTYELLSEKFSIVMWIMQQILFNKFDRRLANFLVNECKKTDSNEIKMSQEEISKYIGSAREVVSRMLKRFENENLIEVSRKSIIVKNLDKLKNI